MKIKWLTGLLTITLFTTVSSAQGLLNKWDVIIEDELKTVAIDTTSISPKGEQISFWVLEEYKKTQEFSENQLEIKRIKSQYLINPAALRYSVIGRLFYDDTGKVVGESSTPGLSAGGENFYVSIQSNSLEELLLNRVSAFLKDDSGTLAHYLEIRSQLTDQGNSDTLSINKINRNPGNLITESSDAEKISKAEISAASNSKKVPVRKSPATDNTASGNVRIYDTATGEYVELKDTNSASETALKDETATSENLPEPSPKYEYSVAEERNVTGTIFTDGSKYCIQVSSWKTKTIADQEAERLKRAGYNTFVLAARPKNKNSVWYRVRIGYFDTLNDAKKAEESIN